MPKRIRIHSGIDAKMDSDSICYFCRIGSESVLAKKQVLKIVLKIVIETYFFANTDSDPIRQNAKSDLDPFWHLCQNGFGSIQASCFNNFKPNEFRFLSNWIRTFSDFSFFQRSYREPKVNKNVLYDANILEDSYQYL